jgi:hypothetical protein
MRASTTASRAATKRKRTSNRASAAVLGTCPVNGQGWCPYPFSPAQLQKRLKEKLAQKQTASKTAKP